MANLRHGRGPRRDHFQALKEISPDLLWSFRASLALWMTTALNLLRIR